MQLVNKTRSYSFDQEAYTRFLQERGFTRVEIACLQVTLRDLPPARLRRREAKEQCIIYGLYANYEISLYAHGDWPTRLNRTLVHETSHYWDAVLVERERAATAGQLTQEDYCSYLVTWLKRRWSEEYFMTGEIRARAYEALYTVEVITCPVPMW